MNKKISVSILSIITLCFFLTSSSFSENNDDQVNVNDSINTESNNTESNIDNISFPQSETNVNPLWAPHNTNSFLIEHGGDPIFDDDDFLSIEENPVQLFQDNHNSTIQKLKQIIESFNNKNNYTINLITYTISELNDIYNNLNTNNNCVIIEQLKKYINKLEELNNKILDNKSLSIDKQQLIESCQISNIISESKMTLNIIGMTYVA